MENPTTKCANNFGMYEIQEFGENINDEWTVSELDIINIRKKTSIRQLQDYGEERERLLKEPNRTDTEGCVYLHIVSSESPSQDTFGISSCNHSMHT